MDLEDRIRAEHGELKRMMALLIETSTEDPDLRAMTYGMLVTRLGAHEEAEERTFYQAMKDEEDLRGMALEGMEQHRIVRMLLRELEKVSVDDELWLPKMRAIKGILESHILIEEGLVLPTIKDFLGREAMDRFDADFTGREKEVLGRRASGRSII